MILKKHIIKRAVALMATVSVLSIAGCSDGEEVVVVALKRI